jgi:serine/threonine protein kinase
MVILEPELSLKLIDFNIAHDLSQDPAIKGANGVRAWSAPETRKFDSYDQSCDVWSIGCILYYLCSGKAPNEQMQTHGLTEETTKKLLASTANESLINLMANLLKPVPSARPTCLDALKHPFLSDA